jgi:DNA repair protein RadA/Sms
MGKCPQCGEWNSLVEEIAEPRARGLSSVPGTGPSEPIALDAVADQGPESRVPTGIGEFDRVLGGGFVPGSLVLLGGEPGIGKSTLLLQVLAGIAGRGESVLYVSGEESISQTAMRARRVGAVSGDIELFAETNLERILGAARKRRPTVLAVDSIQTMHTDALDSIPGAIGQVRDCTARLLAYAKTEGVATVLVGHVTKDGAIAGPKTLEHVVDAVLQFEGEGGSQPVPAVPGRAPTRRTGLGRGRQRRGQPPDPRGGSGARGAAVGGHRPAHGRRGR